MEWYTANILLVMRGPQFGPPMPAEDSSLYSKYMAVQAYLDRYNAEVKKEETAKEEEIAAQATENADAQRQEDARSEASGASDAEHASGPKGRSRYAPEDRERIRRERNRIHAKRTRDRRKKFMEDSGKVRRPTEIWITIAKVLHGVTGSDRDFLYHSMNSRCWPSSAWRMRNCVDWWLKSTRHLTYPE